MKFFFYSHTCTLLTAFLATCFIAGSSAGASDGKTAKGNSPVTESLKVKASQKTAVTASKLEPMLGADEEINSGDFNQPLLARLVFDLTNLERRRAGLSTFEENSYLARSATAHSQDMATRAYFAHKSKGLLSRTDPRDRVESLGYNPSTVAENIAMVPTYTGQTIKTYPGKAPVVQTSFNTYRSLAATAMREWMNSPGHRANILNGKLTNLGVGVAVGMNKSIPYIYLTQNFGG